MNIATLIRQAAGFFDLQDLFVFGGLIAVSVGAWQIYAPLGWIVPGSVSIALGWHMGRGS